MKAFQKYLNLFFKAHHNELILFIFSVYLVLVFFSEAFRQFFMILKDNHPDYNSFFKSILEFRLFIFHCFLF
jgi:hypothetical protein